MFLFPIAAVLRRANIALCGAVAVLLALRVGVCVAEAPPPLPALNIDMAETSISGISSGGFMAVQFQVAHSAIVKGAGIIAAGPYYCAQNSGITATTRCSCTLDAQHQFCSVDATSAKVPELVEATRRFARERLIDDPANLVRQRTLIVAGGRDKIVPAPLVAQLPAYYAAFGVPAEQISLVKLAEAGHGMPTQEFGSACSVNAEPYINRCAYDAAGAVLNWIYGPLAPARNGARQGRFVRFDQRPYIPSSLIGLWGDGLDSSGWLYLPDRCARGEKCRLHIALHGCRQSQSYLPLTPPEHGGPNYGTTFVEHAGYDAWADSNRLVILFPQATSVLLRNPNSCWDWWGYTGGHYADRQGIQIRALRAMVDRLSSGAK